MEKSSPIFTVKEINRWISVILFLFVLISCIEPYNLPEGKNSSNFLVVDGFMDAENGKVTVRLTRSKPLGDDTEIQKETDALVQLEEEGGSTIVLNETGNGSYIYNGLSVDYNKKYRVVIKTNDNKKYASSFVPVLQTSPIDSITWSPSQDGIFIEANTHGNETDSRYYMWNFEETWEYKANHYSSYKFITDDSISYRTMDDLIYTCYNEAASTSILVKSTDRLSSNLVRDFRIHFVPVGSIKLNYKYSVLVKQVSLSREAFDFWSKLSQTTENVGSLFDPQPGQVYGNMVGVTDINEPVLGIFSAGNVTQKRIFIKFNDLPEDLQIWNRGSRYCELDSVLLGDIGSFDRSSNLLVSSITQGIAVIGYTYTTKGCADCRVDGGTLIKPSFW